jgi:hypothetical protein
MTDTKVTFPSYYNTVGHTRMYVMTLTSPPALPLSRPWVGLSMRRFMSSHLLIQGSSLLSVLPYSLIVFWKFKNLTLSVSTSLPTHQEKVLHVDMGFSPNIMFGKKSHIDMRFCHVDMRKSHVNMGFFSEHDVGKNPMLT